MTQAALFASQAIGDSKVDISTFRMPDAVLFQIRECRNADVQDVAYSAAVSYIEATKGMLFASGSWSVIQFYYSAFYCLRAFCLISDVITFHSKKEYVLDVQNNKILKGGRSTHRWEWKSFSDIRRLNYWVFSEDSELTYNKMRKSREMINYREKFLEPDLHSVLVSNPPMELSKRISNYKADSDFYYTYLEDHLHVAYPTKLIYALDLKMRENLIELSLDRRDYLKRAWNFPNVLCPFT